ncbi:FtsX-like permease family protein [Nocardioides lijunqiniae]|uniref:FtsX-like permease family protein n=1 Tax=Nocardioides lijunqiniae TaxID=2760832 RepID=UPI001877E7EE|nr:FtsX-like permease family protein [Nocardioides lijunqiniae]
MLTLVLRRALVQRRLLAAVLVLVTVAAGLLGVCSLLLGVTQERAFHEEVQRSEPVEVDVTAFLVDLSGSDVEPARQEAERVVREVLAPMRPTTTASATARMRRLGSPDRLAYLATGDALVQRDDLTSGRWPQDRRRGPREAVIPESTARLLDLRPGDEVTLGKEIGLGGAERPVRVVVVGTFRQQPGAAWDTDPLSGNGFDPAYSDGSTTAPAYGPFVVGDAAFLASGSSVTGLRVTAHPTLSLADDPSLRAAVTSLDDASPLLTSRVDDRARITRVASDLPRTLDRIHTQQASARATVLVVVLLGTALSLAATLLAGWLLASVRDEERALLVALGLSRRQQLGAAVVEAVALAGAASLLAVPAASLAHSRLTHLPALTTAALTQSPSLTWGLVLAVVGGALLLSLVLVATALDTRVAPDRAGGRLGLRSGLDALLLGVAVLAWWQLRAQPATAATSGDVTLVLAPVLGVAAVTVVVVRAVPLLLTGAARVAARSRSLVLPLAAQQAARRPHTGTAMTLVAAAVAAAVFGLALRATWEQSQDDQAALRVGTDLALALQAPAGQQEASAIASAAGSGSPGPTVSAVVQRPLALGRYVGEPGSRPVVVAVDTAHAGGLLRGRLGTGTTWQGVGDALAPEAPVRGLALSGGTAIELQGRAPAGVRLTATPTVVLQDATGFRSSVTGSPFPLDGRPHAARWRGAVERGSSLVGLRLDIDGAPGSEPARPRAEVSVVLRVPGAADADGDPWSVVPLQPDGPMSGVAVATSGPATEVRTTATVDLTYLAYTGASVLATAFESPDAIPVAVSQDLVDAVGTRVGGELSGIVEGTVLPLRVVAVVATVPSAPGEVAVLADVDTLSRALVRAGRLESVVDAWWVGDPTPGTVRAVRGLGLGEVTTRTGVAEELSEGPLRVTVPTALLTLVVAAVLMLLAGVALVLGGDRRRRTAEVARLRALGLSRRDAWRLLLAEHAAFLVPLVAVGAGVGALASVSLGPHLVRSDLGDAPVPDPVVAWPWSSESLLVGGLLVGALAMAALASARQVRRADPSSLRTGDE